MMTVNVKTHQRSYDIIIIIIIIILTVLLLLLFIIIIIIWYSKIMKYISHVQRQLSVPYGTKVEINERLQKKDRKSNKHVKCR